MKIQVGDRIAPYVKVKLDGAVQKYCTTADDAEGIVERLSLDSDGVPCIEDGEFVQELVSGRVEIYLQDDSPDWAVELFKEISGESK